MLRPIRIIHFCVWADRLEAADVFVKRLPQLDLGIRVTNPADPGLVQMARLDCDWHGENTRAFAAMTHRSLEFLPAHVTGVAGLIDLAKPGAFAEEDRWLVFDGQSPQKLAGVLDRLLPLLARAGLRMAWYAFDEVSRTTSVFKPIAPYLAVLIHDEYPLDPAGRAALNPNCTIVHRSWVSNLIPFSVPFNETPEDKLIFVGSKLGLTDHRKRQIDFLGRHFGDRFIAILDHSLSVADRASLTRYKVSVCPEGRKFSTPAMAMTHTDRPFWSGCMGLVPVSENARKGDRLGSLAEQRFIQRYSHGNLPELKTACERALAASNEDRRKIYDHFNQHETVGTVLAEALYSAVAATPAGQAG